MEEVRLEALRKQQEKITNRMSSLVLQSIVIFGLPAIVGYFVGQYLENNGISKVLAYILPLFITFIFSWFILVKKLNSFKKEIEEVESEIRRLAPPLTNKEDENLDREEDLN